MSQNNSGSTDNSLNNKSVYCLIFNIPETYRSKHLRNYFNELIENNSFNCFHYRHRPQKMITNTNENNQSLRVKRFCALIDIKTERVNDLFNKFNNKYWVDQNGLDLEIKCFIRRIKIVDDPRDYDYNLKTKDKSIDLLRTNIELNSSLDSRHRNKSTVKRLKTVTDSTEIEFSNNTSELKLTLNQLKSLREFHPPTDIMPNGNVGTPSTVFLQLIRECRLPAAVISKLDLEFPKSMRKRIYSGVEYNYGSNKVSENKSKCDEPVNNYLDLVKTRKGHIINDNFVKLSNSYVDKDIKSKTFKKSDGNKISDGSDEDEEEEWDRYESLHDDVTEQERTKERLFEEEVEFQWEKGGSGLVFYTDAQFWDLSDNKRDFDEKTADDWDLDMSLYRKSQSSADNDAIHLMAIRDQIKLRKGKRKSEKFKVNSVYDNSNSQIGCFERHTKGIGRQVMERQGWKSGSGLGKCFSGIAEPIPDCGQLPSDKRGLGYRGEKLQSSVFKI